MISKEYLAGLIDGEAWIGLVFTKKNQFVPRIEIDLGGGTIKGNTNLNLLKEVQKQYGGNLCKSVKRCNRLTFRVEETKKLLKELLPFIRIKKQTMVLMNQIIKAKEQKKSNAEINLLILSLRTLNTGIKKEAHRWMEEVK